LEVDEIAAAVAARPRLSKRAAMPLRQSWGGDSDTGWSCGTGIPAVFEWRERADPD
jgi:hypothetical protein